MRRQTKTGGANPAWVGQPMRLDPSDLPARFRVPLLGPDARAVTDTDVEIDRTRAVMHRHLAGSIPVRVSIPLKSYSGIAVRFVDAPAAGNPLIALELHHSDPALSLPLAVAADMDDLIADWRGWSRELGLPLLTIDETGRVSEIGRRLGAVALGATIERRLYRLIADRRPRFLVRRNVGAAAARENVAAREIIARR